jgi:hypothetical protein
LQQTSRRGQLRSRLTRDFWWRFHRKEFFAVAIVCLIAAVVVALAVWREINPETTCEGSSLGCNLTTEVLGTLIVAAIGLVIFVWKLRAIVRAFADLARDEPASLLDVSVPEPIAGGERYEHELFDVIARDLLYERPSEGSAPGDRNGRGDLSTPARAAGKLITGGAGTGKTTAMVGLTRFLARHQVIPIPVSLRGVTEPINLIQLAHDQFQDRVNTRTLFGDHGDRVFARLRARGQAVILADGLDEAMPKASRGRRELALSAAIEDALGGGVPVVATSRTVELGHGLALAHFELPPLSGEDAIKFLGIDPRDEALCRTVETACVSETPFYLEIAAPLVREGALEDWRGDDATALRVNLLDRYVDAVCSETLLPDADVNDRKVAVKRVSAIAYMMLRQGRPSMSLQDLEADADRAPAQAAAGAEPVDVDAAVDDGLALGLVELLDQESVQFVHSVMQSYLASRVIREDPGEDAGSVAALLGGAVSPELLTAIVMAGSWRDPDASAGDRHRRGRQMVDKLLGAARKQPKREALALVSAASKLVASAGPGEQLTDDVGEAAAKYWSEADVSTRLEAVDALGRLGGAKAYDALRQALDDPEFSVRLAAGKELGRGGEAAYELMRQEVGGILKDCGAVGGDADPALQKKLAGFGYVLPLLRRDEGEGHVPEVDRLIALVKKGVGAQAEATIARGFKADAWGAPRRSVDASKAGDLLDATRWWYPKLCLLHALTLRAVEAKDEKAKQRVRAEAERADAHPFAREAAQQCVKAIDSGEDVRLWIWKDEPDVVKHAHWRRDPGSRLMPEAVQLAADVALAMDLSLRLTLDPSWGDDPNPQRRAHEAQVAKWLNNQRVPYCLESSNDRAEVLCGDCHPNCEFGFCREEEAPGTMRGEFSEAFCRQQRMSPPRLRDRPPWQQRRWPRRYRHKRGMRRFWGQMMVRTAEQAATQRSSRALRGR